jgi:hypothetical protein
VNGHVHLDRETPRRLTVAAVVVAFVGVSLAAGQPPPDRVAFFQLALVVSSYGVLAVVVPSVRSHLDPDRVLAMGAAFVAFAVVLAAASQIIGPN